MRVTNQSVTRNYLKGLHGNRALLNKYSEQTYTGQRFSHMGENPSGGIRAMQVRRNLTRVDGYLDNAKAAKSTLAAAEKSIMQMSEITREISRLTVQGISDDNGSDEREAIAKQVEALQKEMLAIANTQFAGKYQFGGTNNVSAPFTLDATTNELLYNGHPVAGIGANSDLLKDANYIEVGLGITFNPNSSQNVDPNSAFKNTYVGLDFMGYGPNNLYALAGKIVDTLRSGVNDKDAAGKLLDDFNAAASQVTLQITQFGADDNYLDFTIDRLESERITLIERQQSIELKEADEAILDLKMQEYVYNAALQMGQRLMQPTLFDFMK